MRTNLSGIILAGGKSSRFGGDKPLAALAGRSLLERAVDTLRPWVADIAINAPAKSATEVKAKRLGFSVVSDRAGLVGGPLCGILAGLEWSASLGAHWMISLPCDMVALPANTFSRLLAAAVKAHGAHAVTAQGPQSLCAVWPVESKNALEATLISGIHPSVRDFVKAIGAAAVHFDESGMFLNVNTREDLLAAEKALSA